MLNCLVRLVLAMVCTPLLGAYGLRWAAGCVRDVLMALGLTKGLVVPLLDYYGAGLGALVGIYLGLQLAASCCQRRDEPLRATADVLLLILTGLFLADALLPPLLANATVSAVLPPLSLVVWLATGAAALRLSGFRRRASRRRPGPAAPPVEEGAEPGE